MNKSIKEVKVDLEVAAKQYLKFLPMGNNIDEQTKFQFLEVCKNFQLNPFKKEIYLILRRQKDRSGNYVDVFNIVVGYEAYRRRAEKIGDMDGGILVDTVLDEQTALPIKSTATLYRKGKTHAYSKTVYFNEFAQKTVDGRLMSLWASKPIFMLEKVAEATLLRMAYPCEFEAMPYIAEEMPIGEEAVNVKEEKGIEFPSAKIANKNEAEVVEEGTVEQISVSKVDQKIAKTGKAYFVVKDLEGNNFVSFSDEIVNAENATINAVISANERNGKVSKIIKSFNFV
jgi:phage recombination protein Bet